MTFPEIDLEIEFHLDDLPSTQLTELDARFRRIAEWVVARFSLSHFTCSVSVVDDPTIHEVNRTHLQHDWPTDVISFVFENAAGVVDGEIIVSWDTARRLSDAAGWTPEDELSLYALHGMLHLVGLDDIDDADRAEMRQTEFEALCELQVPGAERYLDRWQDVSY